MSRSRPPAEQPVRRWVSPYGVRDWLVVAKNNLRQRPTSRHRHLTSWAAPDLVVDRDVAPQASVALLGDLMPVRGRHRFVLDDGLVAELEGCDHLVVNLEGVLWPGPGPAPKVFAAQHHPDLRVLEALEAAVPPARTVVSVANNHAADFGWVALDHTLGALAERGHPVIGTADRPTTRLAGAVNLAAATQWTNQRHTYLSRLDDHADLVDPGADLQLLVPHWGFELETHPRPATVATAHRLVQRWDAVVGHHPHVPCPVTTLPGPDGGDRVVAYSLGQASSDLRYPIYRHGLVVRLDLGPRPDGRWAVGRTRWRFLGLGTHEDGTVVAGLRTEDRWLPDAPVA